jgi:hypothetical protein
MTSREASPVRFRFQADVIYWRGPSPFFFVRGRSTPGSR